MLQFAIQRNEKQSNKKWVTTLRFHDCLEAFEAISPRGTQITLQITDCF